MTDTLAEHADPTLHRGEPLVQMENVGKSFGPIVALSGINLQVNAGEVACVLGDNGAGKSTLIKIISGLHPHTEGTLKVDGQTVTGNSSSQLGESVLKNGSWKEGKLVFELEGQNGVISMSAVVVEGKLSGEFDFAGQLQGKWVAVKKN